MIGILIVAHGALGECLIHCASHVLGRRPLRLRQLGVTVHDDPELILPHAKELVKDLDDGSGVLILSDICGATPCNIASRLINPGHAELLSGVSLPMLVRALTYREENLDSVIQKAMAGGVNGVMHLNAQSDHPVE
jgi:PTS system ascorbate-specific IIA component